MFNLDGWSTAVAADPTITKDESARIRWAGIVALADDTGLMTTSSRGLAAAIGKTQAANINAVEQLTRAGYLVKLKRGKGGGKGATTNVYQLTIPRQNAATIVDFPTDRAELLKLARQVGNALLQFSKTA